jgi:hypothetical protein
VGDDPQRLVSHPRPRRDQVGDVIMELNVHAESKRTTPASRTPPKKRGWPLTARLPDPPI